jgi:hypothetical protein
MASLAAVAEESLERVCMRILVQSIELGRKRDGKPSHGQYDTCSRVGFEDLTPDIVMKRLGVATNKWHTRYLREKF